VHRIHPTHHLYICHVPSHCLTKAGMVKTKYIGTLPQSHHSVYHANYFADRLCCNLTSTPDRQCPPRPTFYQPHLTYL
jgi:hypothetical protein